MSEMTFKTVEPIEDFAVYEERARSGAWVMDDFAGNWQWVVNPNDLDLEYGHRCVLGQYLGDWELAPATMAMDEDEFVANGFMLIDGTRAQFEALNVAWRREINFRRERDLKKTFRTQHIGEVKVAEAMAQPWGFIIPNDYVQLLSVEQRCLHWMGKCWQQVACGMPWMEWCGASKSDACEYGKCADCHQAQLDNYPGSKSA
ncbi:hypothetical protein ACQPYK_49680 (plasmid) [Streptosporangium sp. CA-135522]|uniref:hypothetical protein n=1 Tax=Streptosporangium sp. CA-135522 TaxID=3240072 RepID=UPI003D94FF8F